MKLKIPLNIPNILSLYRLLSFPIVLIIAILGYQKLFAILICIDLITDILDGFIARTFNMKTEIGAKLDSIADLGMFILAFTGIFLFKYFDFEPRIYIFSIYLGLYIFCHLFAILKFKRLPSLHLYSWKIGGYIQGIFFFVLFAFQFNIYLFYIMVVWSILSSLEHLTIQIIIKQMISNAKGLYWVLKSL